MERDSGAGAYSNFDLVIAAQSKLT
jgi:hypothetical protein